MHAKSRTLVVLSAFALAAAAYAGPLKKAHVPKDAQWVVHVDLQAALGSTCGRYVLDHRADFHLDELDQVKAETGMDVLVDVKDITVYGAGPTEQDCVAIMHTTAAVDEFVAKARAKKEGIEEIALGKYKVLSWTEDGASKYAQIRPDGEGRIVIAGGDKDHLLAGIGLLEGKGESLAGQTTGLAETKPRAGSFIFAAANHIPHAESLQFKRAEALTLDLGEDKTEFYADVTVTAKSSEEAANMNAAAQGIVALGRLALSSDPELKDALQLLDGLKSSCDGNKVIATFRFPSDKLGAAMKQLEDSKFGDKPEGRSKKAKGGKKDAGDKDR